MLRLELQIHDSIPIEAAAMVPDRLVGKTVAEIARLPLFHGNRPILLADAFQISGDASDGIVEISGDCTRIKNLGKEMKAGQLTVHGNAGMHLGADMTGGRIDVHGCVGDWLGAEMHDGHIHIHGSAGNLAGAAYRAEPIGMRGGVILIDGDAGDEIGANMRRGLIAVGGRCGDMPGISMIAGSIFAFGGIGARPGAGMKRGSIVVLNGPVELPPTFRGNGDCDPVFLHLYIRQLRSWGFTTGKMSKLFRRFSGDLLTLGKGEILVALPD